MDPNTCQLSILLTTHIPLERLENLLSATLNVKSSEIEIIIIDDAAGDETKSAIQQLVRTSSNERVFLFEHDTPIGRGRCLNEALNEASGSFVWAPVKANRFNEKLLKDALRRFYSSPAAFWVMDFDLPSNSTDWLEQVSEAGLPDDSCFIWNRKILGTNTFFFNPFITHLHGAELAFRVYNKNAWHKTDPFFVVDDDQSIPAIGKNLEEFFHSAHRSETDQSVREEILILFKNINTEKEKTDIDDGYLAQSHQLLAQGDANRALILVDKFLRSHPEHHEAVRLKITTLEKLRRHVEAAELKHHLKGMEPINPPQAELFMGEDSKKETITPKQIDTSIVIPTTALGKPHLEACLLALEEHVDSTTTELVVIDNASFDDTFDYLEQLQKEEFLNIKVVTNQQNKGFGASINQGIEAASGKFILAMHTDVRIRPETPSILKEAFFQLPDLGLSAPTINETDYAAQLPDEKTDDPYIQTDKVDSCCFMIRKDLKSRFDENYGLAFMEMDDFCFQIGTEGLPIVVAQHTTAEHQTGKITGLMGLKLIPQMKWENRARFHDKWMEEERFNIPAQGSYADRFEKLGAPIDPANPKPQWIETVKKSLTDEVKTDIFRSDLPPNELITIVSTLLMADERELLRTLEDRLDEIDLPQAVLVLFINYYYEKNIYSRCKHYLKKAGDQHPIFDLYRLKISVADKELDEASKLLAKLMEEYPCSPDLLFLAGQLYRHSGDEDEAKSFFAMASQIDPARFSNEETAFEIKF
ncbi:MAG: glycosyltransferase [Balneolaceae bacterium]